MAKKINRDNANEASQKKVSTVFRVGDIVCVDANGFLVPGGATAAKGVCNEQVQASDSDYAVARDLNFVGFDNDDVFEFPVITGSATQTMVGELHDIDATDARGVDVTASTNKQILITRVLSTSLVWGKFVPQVA